MVRKPIIPIGNRKSVLAYLADSLDCGPYMVTINFVNGFAFRARIRQISHRGRPVDAPNAAKNAALLILHAEGPGQVALR